MNGHKCSRSLEFVLLVSVMATAHGAPEDGQKIQVIPSEIKWTAVPAVPGEKISWLTGGQDKTEPYALRAHLAKGATIPPHTHPDRRCVTVLSGNVHFAEGKTADINHTKQFPAGSFLCVQAGVPHYVIAKDGDAEFQDSGFGPTATVFLNK